MQKLKKLLNPLNIPYGIQDELLQAIDGNYLLGLGEDDFIEAIKLDGKIIPYQFRLQDIEEKSDFYIEMKNDIANAKSVFIIIETLENEGIENYKDMIKDISSIVDEDNTFLIDSKIVSKISYEPINIMLFGYEDNSMFALEVGDNFAQYWSDNSSYCLEEFHKMKEKVSKELKKEINGIRITSHSRSPNIVELVDSQSFQAIRAFEFNEQTKDEFTNFLRKLEVTLKKQ